MKPLPAILCLALACCVSPPRAIIPPPSEIRALDVEPVIEASGKTRKAVRDLADAGQQTRAANERLRSTAEQLREVIDRAESLAKAEAELQQAFAEIQRFAVRMSSDLTELSAALALAEEKERIALDTIDVLDAENALLKSNSAAQAVEIRESLAHESVLRKQVKALSKSTDDLVIAKDKLEWWRWAAGITWFVLVLYVAARILLRNANPFRF